MLLSGRCRITVNVRRRTTSSEQPSPELKHQMFNRIVIDTTSYPASLILGEGEQLQVEEARLLSCAYFVADEISEVYPKFNDVDGQLKLFKDIDTLQPILPNKAKKRKRAGHPIAKDVISELRYRSYEVQELGSFLSVIGALSQSDAIAFSNHPNVKWWSLKQGRKSARSAVLALAMAGIDVALPKVQLDLSRREEYIKVKRSLEEERLNYLRAISRYADEALDRLQAKPNIDTILWAQDQAVLKIGPRVAELELALGKMNQSLLKKLAFTLFTEGVPVLGSTLSHFSDPQARAGFLVKILEILSKQFATGQMEQRYPDAIYQLRLSKKLSLSPR